MRRALICPATSSLPPGSSDDDVVVFHFYPYLMFVSAVFLAATFAVYALLAELRNVHGVAIMCYVSSLAVTYVCLGVIQLGPQLDRLACVSLGASNKLAVLNFIGFYWLLPSFTGF